MSVLFIDQVFNSRFIQALSWMLIHSLWIGMLMAIVTGVVIVSTKKSSALLRYNLLAVVFAGFILATAATFFFEYVKPLNSEVVTSASVIQNTEVNNVIQTSTVQENEQAGYFKIFAGYFNANAPLVVLIWFLFFLMQTVKLFAGLHYIHRIRHHNINHPGGYWINKLKQMSNSLGVHQQVIFLQSEIIKMPVVVGFLKPAILVPAGLLTHLPADQVETILLHELAHIRRKDYFVNLLQSFAQAIFFFNPAVLWISSLIREEREACCDDIVLANTGNKGSYLNALVSFHEYGINNNSYALSLIGKKSFLFNRVKRMITYENKKLNIMEKLFLLSGIVVFSAFTYLTNGQKTKPANSFFKKESTIAEVANITSRNEVLIKEAPAKVKIFADDIPPVTIDQDTVPKKSKFNSLSTNIDKNGNTTTAEIKAKATNGKSYRIKKVNDKVTELYVNDERIPDAQISSYQEIFDEIDALHARRVEEAEKRKKEAAVRRQEMEERMKEQRARIAENRRVDADRRLVEQSRWRDQRASIAERNRELQKKIATSQTHRAIEMQRASRLRNIDHQKRNIELNRARLVAPPTVASPNATTSIINELLRENVVESADKIKFSLDNKKLVVNGKKQPDELHKRLKERYLKGEGDSIDYTKDKDGTKTTIVTN